MKTIIVANEESRLIKVEPDLLRQCEAALLAHHNFCKAIPGECVGDICETRQALRAVRAALKNDSPQPQRPDENVNWSDAASLVQSFHDTYESLAPQFGYETRPDTKSFDASSPNGKLMIAVCETLLPQRPGRGGEEVVAGV